jgi:hypothetical protein
MKRIIEKERPTTGSRSTRLMGLRERIPKT